MVGASRTDTLYLEIRLQMDMLFSLRRPETRQGSYQSVVTSQSGGMPPG